MYNTIRSTAAKYNSIALNYLNVYRLSSTASVILGSLSDDGNENSNEPIGLIGKITTLHVHHAFLYISLQPLHDYNVKTPDFTFCRGREHKTTTFFSFPEF